MRKYENQGRNLRLLGKLQQFFCLFVNEVATGKAPLKLTHSSSPGEVSISALSVELGLNSHCESYQTLLWGKHNKSFDNCRYCGLML